MLALAPLSPAHGFSLNKSITIDDGAEAGAQSSVNGSISIGEGAVISGSVETVNGTIRIDENAQVKDAETVNGSIRISSGATADDVGSVNGSIRLAENVTVSGEVSVVNGKISLDKGTTVADDVSNINGEIMLAGAEIGGDLTTVNGDVTLDDGSTLRGNLIIEKPGGWGWNRNKREPKIIIGPGSKVIGNIELEREVELYISESAEVGGVSGVMSMDDAVRFSGARP
jgi:carbonic anhydrase/acetyltransferase-like protein (isoleucine patch superfamily)